MTRWMINFRSCTEFCHQRLQLIWTNAKSNFIFKKVILTHTNLTGTKPCVKYSLNHARCGSSNFLPRWFSSSFTNGSHLQYRQFQLSLISLRTIKHMYKETQVLFQDINKHSSRKTPS